MKATVSISRDIAALPPRRRLWRWYVLLWGPLQNGHMYAHDKVGSRTPVGAVYQFVRHGLKWLLKAWCLR